MKRIAITMGDPAGIGPEVAVKAAADRQVRNTCMPVIIGDPAIIREAAGLCRIKKRVARLSSLPSVRRQTDSIHVIDTGPVQQIKRGSPSASSGRAAVRCIRVAAKYAMKGLVDSIVAAPISKEALGKAGYKWPGHTEMLASIGRSREYAMMFMSEDLNVILCTIHVPLKDVPAQLNRAGVLRTIRLARKGMMMTGKRHPRIIVAGLNPHAGESGRIGDEEAGVIIPAIEDARSEGMEVAGPYPPDTVFNIAQKEECDIVVCMYHDQGLIPFKMLAFDRGVNVTVGLPFIRTSPDHGTAYDIAWKGIADPASMIEAVRLAAHLRLVP
jgi:4-hydroxythreonine-4-phosphate dehydrogenase